MMVIATCNDTDAIAPVILDRFRIINIDGYTREDKGHIIKEYILPALEGRFRVPISLSMTDAAEKKLLDKYGTKSGVRQMQKAIEGIVSAKIFSERVFDRAFDRANDSDRPLKITLTEKDIDSFLKTVIK